MTDPEKEDFAKNLVDLQEQLRTVNIEARDTSLAEFISAKPWEAMRALKKPKKTTFEQKKDIEYICKNFADISTGDVEELRREREILTAKLNSYDRGNPDQGE